MAFLADVGALVLALTFTNFTVFAKGTVPSQANLPNTLAAVQSHVPALRLLQRPVITQTSALISLVTLHPRQRDVIDRG